MDSDSLRQTLEHSSIAAIGVGFLAGLAFSFNPVALASIPVSLAYVTKAREKIEAIFFGGMFILGMIVTHMVLGLAAGLGGEWVGALLGREWAYVLGPLLILLGLVWTGWLRIPLPRFGFRAKRPTAAWGAFLLGIPFSIAVCPVCTPALIVLLGVAAGLGSVWIGISLLLAFAIGRAIPLALGAIAIGWLENGRWLSPYRRAFEITGGLTLMASGLYLLNAMFFWIPALAS